MFVFGRVAAVTDSDYYSTGRFTGCSCGCAISRFTGRSCGYSIGHGPNDRCTASLHRVDPTTGDHINWLEQPELSDAIMLAAFSGWNDAGDAATEATRYLRRRFRGRRVATIDPEYFYDFASVRPNVQLRDGERRIDWPRPEIRLGELDNGEPLVTLVGVEPRLRWRTFSEVVVTLAKQMGITRVATLGALLTGTHHKAPTNVVGTSSNPALNLALGLRQSTYEGPTGIIGVLNDACHRAGLVSVSFWAAVPTYVSSYPSPKAALALVERVSEFLGMEIDDPELQAAAANYEEHIDKMVTSDSRLSQYAQQVWEESAAEAAEDFIETAENPESLVTDLERFLRQEEN